MADAAGNILLLVTGATGYIGGRLVPRLLQAGYRGRCFVRDPERLQGRPSLDQVEVVAGGILQAETLAPAMVGVGAAYYLIHSMAGGQGFHERDLIAGAQLRRGRGGCRCRPHHLYGWPGRPRNETLAASRSRQDTGAGAARERRAGDGVSRRCHRRFGEPVVRADPLPDRAFAVHDLPALALHVHPTHRHPQRVGAT